MAILGATTNTGIGFLLPIVFYLKLENNRTKQLTNHKIICYICFVAVCICSVIELYTYVYSKLYPDSM